MLKIYNGKFALLLLLKESSPAVLSSSSMWVHSINNYCETHGEYVIIFIGRWHHIDACVISVLCALNCLVCNEYLEYGTTAVTQVKGIDYPKLANFPILLFYT